MRAPLFAPLLCAVALLLHAPAHAQSPDSGSQVPPSDTPEAPPSEVPDEPAANTVTATIDTDRSSLSFTSDAPTERILGTMDGVTGTIVFDPAAADNATGTFAFPVTSMRTGNSMRDRHLAGSDWLTADEHPDVTFTLERVQVTEQGPSEDRIDLTGTAYGQVSFNGVSQPVESPVNITLSTETQRLRVQLEMTVNLRDHEVRGRAGSIGREVAEEIEIEGTIYAGW